MTNIPSDEIQKVLDSLSQHNLIQVVLPIADFEEKRKTNTENHSWSTIFHPLFPLTCISKSEKLLKTLETVLYQNFSILEQEELKLPANATDTEIICKICDLCQVRCLLVSSIHSGLSFEYSPAGADLNAALPIIVFGHSPTEQYFPIISFQPDFSNFIPYNEYFENKNRTYSYYFQILNDVEKQLGFNPELKDITISVIGKKQPSIQYQKKF